ncbi:uncharacterized protein LOC122025642 isoform X2 [Zingiber officinale]|uniref:uncharacterized protein LOC122025642 isoform X2 n=1 Tax=Zingiber officinale TaxID=94328 RepID=UPI001C4DBE63|nr:uncharacterized protein LOC122025642 isoform X2 [Zingiber officinale]
MAMPWATVVSSPPAPVPLCRASPSVSCMRNRNPLSKQYASLSWSSSIALVPIASQQLCRGPKQKIAELGHECWCPEIVFLHVRSLRMKFWEMNEITANQLVLFRLHGLADQKVKLQRDPIENHGSKEQTCTCDLSC